nr:LPD7 domain-containing protein [Ochrobactrum sp. MC-1LL]
MDRSFPDEITSRYYIREDHGGTQRVFADSKGEREVFQDNGEKLRAKSFDAQGVRLMIETAAHRGWTSIEITGSKEFRRETWLEGQAHGISVKGYQPTELDWQDLARREQSYLRNEIVPIEGRALDAAHRDQEQSAGSDQSSKVDREPQNADNSGTSHSKTIDYKEGVQGILVETGEKPYQDNEKNEPSPFVVIETANGNRTVWGVGLPDALHRAGAEIGDEIHLRSTGTERVLKTVIQEVDGQKQRVEQMVDRRAWEADVLEERDRTDGKVEGSKQLDNQVNMEVKGMARDGETIRTDPPQQQVSRVQELEQEQQQKKERDEHER